ncbi:MAG: RDD family protein [Acidobacteriota bacterium]
MPRVQTLKIRTPEGITFSLPLASPVSRFLAVTVDIACLHAASSLAISVFRAFGIVSLDLASGLWVVFEFVLQLGYAVVLEWLWRGQTLGKRLLGLRVMDAFGLRLQPSQVVIRNLLRAVDVLPLFYLVGGASCWLSRQGQRLGDLAANTIVVRHARFEEPNFNQLLSGKYNSLKAYPHLEARLQQRTSPQEAALALQALLRRDELRPEARMELFRELADHFKTLVPFPEEALEGLADEQYVRNVVEVLFHPRRMPRPV